MTAHLDAHTEPRHHRLCAYAEIDGHCTCADIADRFEAELDEAIEVLRSHSEVIHLVHQRHGGSPVFEDVCCREVGRATSVLAKEECRRLGYNYY